MSQNIQQIFVANPASTMISTDLLYLGRSPYNTADDFAITFANFTASIGINLLGDFTFTGDVLSNATTNANINIQPKGTGGTLFGTNTALTGINYSLQLASNGQAPLLVIGAFKNTTGAPEFRLYKSRSTTIGTFASVNSGDMLGDIEFYGDDGTSFHIGAEIYAQVSGSVSTGIVPTELLFSTTNTSGTLTTAMVITPAQIINLTNALPVASGGTGITSFGTGIATALGTNLNGSGAFAGTTGPTFVTPALGAATATSINFGGSSLSNYVSSTAFTPVITFATPGDLSVVYSTQLGQYVRIGNLVTVSIQLAFTPTYTTASGTFIIASLPFTANNNVTYPGQGAGWISGPLTWPSSGTNLSFAVGANTSQIIIIASVPAGGPGVFSSTQITTGLATTISCTVTYLL